MTLDELEALDGPTPPTPSPAAPRALTPADLDALEAPAPNTPAVPPPAAPGSLTPADIEALDAPAQPETTHPQGLDAPADTAARYDAAGQIGGAIVTGAAKSIYQTSDFLFGKPEEADKTETRRSVEALDKSLGESSIANSFVSGLSQFAVGMLGAGKVVSAAKLLPVAGAAITGAEATRKGAMLLSTGKAAAVGAVAFDPNGPRLSDLVVLKGPWWLQTSVTAYLAHSGHEDDSAALGRVKNALESIGVDASVGVVFAGSLWVFKALKGGDSAAIQAATEELAQAVAHKDAKLAASKGDTETLAALRETHPEATAQAEASLLPARVEGAGSEVTTRPDGTAEVTLPELRTETPAAETAGMATRPAPLLEVSDEQVSRLIQHGEADTAALMGPGGWEGALERGYKFGDGGRIPWQKFALEAEHAPRHLAPRPRHPPGLR